MHLYVNSPESVTLVRVFASLQSTCGDQLQDPDSDSSTGTGAQRADGGGGAVTTFKCKLKKHYIIYLLRTTLLSCNAHTGTYPGLHGFCWPMGMLLGFKLSQPLWRIIQSNHQKVRLIFLFISKCNENVNYAICCTFRCKRLHFFFFARIWSKSCPWKGICFGL